MSWLRRYPVFAATLLLLGLAMMGEGVLVAGGRKAAQTARKRLDQVSRELRAQATTRPAPTPENAALIEADLAHSAQTLAALQGGLRPTGDKAAKFLSAGAPIRRPEAFFDIAGFVEAMRSRAREAGVTLRPDERFGFSSYVHEAPETSQLTAVFRERLVLQYLLEALLEAQPHQLLSVQRSRPGGKPGVGALGKSGGRAGRGESNFAAADYFEMDPRISARVPGLIEAAGFRLSFTGHTETLRALLTKLAEFELPVAVRAVEVAPAERPPGGSVSGQPPAVPLVAAAWSRFTVTVEYLAPIVQPPASG